jgi:hypothetical protein
VIRNRGAAVALSTDEGKWGTDNMQGGGVFYRHTSRKGNAGLCKGERGR